MGNIMGKTLRECKKIWETVRSSASDVGAAVSDATKGISGYASIAIKIAMKKSEIEDLYHDLGKSVFEGGLLPDNETSLGILNVLFEKNEDLECLEEELESYSESNYRGNGPLNEEDWGPFGDFDNECDWNLDKDACDCNSKDCHCKEDASSISFQKFMDEMRKLYKDSNMQGKDKDIK